MLKYWLHESLSGRVGRSRKHSRGCRLIRGKGMSGYRRFSIRDATKLTDRGRAIPKMDDPAKLLRILGRDSIEQLEGLLEEDGMILDYIVYRDRETGIQGIWQAKK